MSNNIFVIVEHLNGKTEDITYEMLGKARALASSTGGSVVAVLLGSGASGLAADYAADKVLYIDHSSLAEFNPEAYCRALAEVINNQRPQIVLVGNSSQGIDIGAALSVDCNMPIVAYASDMSANSVTSQLYGGKMSVESGIDDGGYIASVLPGSFPADAGKGSGAVVEEVAVGNLDGLNITFKRLIEPQGGDVDITANDILVSVGRGIQNEDNLEIVQELADKLGGVVACSRPIVDSKWLPKTRQVGKSGLKVKPKVYIAVGISGAPEHIEGMKDAELIVAINSDPKAPIFDYAHYGAVGDLFDIIPALTEKL